jgi:asparagine synthase (glutamine-hydrolysing)
MIGSMRHEGFYVSDCYSVPKLGTYAGWIAHDRSFATSQPFLNERGDIALLFAGECFIDPEARCALTQNRYGLAKDGADWLVRLYEEEGNRFFESLNGLFSGLLIDKRLGKVFLFNDRYGVERLYWHQADGEFYFASEAKALLQILPELRKFDTEGVAQFLTYRCTLGARTLFKGINLLPGGSLWSFEGGKCQKRKYFSPQEWESQPPLSPERFQSEFEETFNRILPRYFESEPRIGISLTSGLDSRMIMACRPEITQNPICYTFSGYGRDTLDARLAAQVAKGCGLEHETLRIEPEFFSEFASHVDRTVYITDGYLGTLGAHEIWFNKRARSLAPVRLTGVFGGEILRGVSMFKPLSLSPRLVRPDLARSVSSPQWKLRDSQHRVTFAAFREIPEKRFGPPAAGRSQISFRTPYLDNEVVALAYRVPENLRSSSFPAVDLIKHSSAVCGTVPTDMGEITRTHRLASVSRRILSRAVFKVDYFYNEGLPHWLSHLDPLFRRLNSRMGIVGRYKFLHYRSWFQQELASYVKTVLTDARTRESQFFNSDFLEHMAVEHTRGRKNYVLEIDAVITLEAVERLLFRGLPCDPRVAREARGAIAANSLCTANAASAN